MDNNIILDTLLQKAKAFAGTPDQDEMVCIDALSLFCKCQESSGELSPAMGLITEKLGSPTPANRYKSIKGLIYDLEKARTCEMFFPGEQDIAGTLHFKDVLYGRELEIEKVLTWVAEKESQFLMLGGDSGVGKTALIQKGIAPVLEEKGCLIQEKCEQYKGGYLSLFEGVLGKLRGQVPCESLHNKIDDICNKKVQYDTEEIYFKILLGVLKDSIAGVGELALFLDDLQWADTGSLAFLEQVLNESIGGLCIIGAYRHAECGEGHPLMALKERLSKTPSELYIKALRPQHIESFLLEGIGVSDISEQVSESFGMEHAKSVELGQLIYEKTKGNPFHIKQYLITMVDRGAVWFKGDKQEWDYDRLKVKEAYQIEEGYSLVAARLARLPKETLWVLEWGSVMGYGFDKDSLGLISQRTSLELALHMRYAEQKGVVFETEVGWKFNHDQLQEAIYTRIKNPAKRHAQIARLLNASDSKKKYVLEIARHSMQGLDALLKEELGWVISSFESAIETCRKTAHFKGAYLYYEAGLHILKKHGQKESDLYFEQLLGAWEMKRLMGEAADALKVELETYTQSCEKHAKLVAKEVSIHAHYDNKHKAIQTGITFLKAYGFSFPNKFIMMVKVLSQLLIWRLFKKRTLKQFAELTPCEDKTLNALADVSSEIIGPTYMHDQNLLLYVIISFQKLFSKRGYLRASAWASAAVSMIYIYFGAYQMAFSLRGSVKFIMNDPRIDKKNKGRTFFIYAAFVDHWRHSYSQTMCLLNQALECLEEAKDFLFMGYANATYLMFQLIQGTPIPEMKKNLDSCHEKATLQNEKWSLLFFETYQSCLASYDTVEGVNLEPVIENIYKNSKGNDQVYLLFYMYYFCIMRHCIFKEENIECVKKQINESYSLGKRYKEMFSSWSDFLFYIYLASSFYGIKLSFRKRWLIERSFKKWSEFCPENFMHKHLFIQAEKYKKKKRFAKAMAAYLNALGLAQRYGYLHHEGMIAEALSSLYMACGEPERASVMFDTAIKAYEKWGALAKVNDMEKNGL